MEEKRLRKKTKKIKYFTQTLYNNIQKKKKNNKSHNNFFFIKSFVVNQTILYYP